MPEGFVQVDEGTGKKLHTFQRTIAPNDVHDEVVVQGEPYVAAYAATTSAVSLATVNSHALALWAGASKVVRIHRIRVNLAGGAGTVRFTIVRLTSAGSGGTVVTPAPMDTSDSASGATARSLPTTKGTEGVALQSYIMGWPSASPTDHVFEWVAIDRVKPIYVPAGTANGIAIRNTAFPTTDGADILIEFTEAAF